VLLEGLEVAFIVISFGSGQHRLPVAATAAALALVAVAGVGALVRAPLARVPENRIKFAVGVMLTGFGCFWAVEGTGVRWPGDELALFGLLVFTSVTALSFVGLLRRLLVGLPARGRLAARPRASACRRRHGPASPVRASRLVAGSCVRCVAARGLAATGDACARPS
jgi:hypothetical protein